MGKSLKVAREKVGMMYGSIFQKNVGFRRSSEDTCIVGILIILSVFFIMELLDFAFSPSRYRDIILLAICAISVLTISVVRFLKCVSEIKKRCFKNPNEHN